MASTPPALRRTFPEALRSRSDEHLVALLLQRPDLATPSPSTLRSLAARATSRTSLDRAIARLDALELQVLESVLVLGEQHAFPTSASRPAPTRPTRCAPGDDTAVTVDRVLGALGASDADAPVVRAALAHLEEAALLWDRDPSQRTDLAVAPGLSEVLGPYPAGLGPTDPSSPLAARPAGAPAPADVRPGTGPADLADLLSDAPPGARSILDALTWGPPVGVAPRADPVGREATTWLLRQRLLLASDERHVVLPREVALALREGRTHAKPLARAPEPDAPRFAEDTIAAEAARAAQDVVRLVAHLLALWQASPPSVLRAGGLGVRDLRRLATTLEVDEPTAAFVAELALATGLVVDDGEDPPSFTVTIAGEDWLDLPLSPRWALLAAAWAGSGRTPWTVGSRDERGTLRAALEPDLTRPWVPRLRFDLLSALADRPGTALSPDDLLEVLRWGSPRSVPPLQAIEGLLHEAHLLGVTGVGALAPTGRALLLPDGAAPAARTSTSAGSSRSGAPPLTSTEAALATALESVLPPEVDDLLLQGDLTGIVPGRPSTALERLLEDAAEVESRGAAITVRFTPESLTRAFDAGRTADDLLADLAGHSRASLPQPLDYLVRDTARRHGRLRVGSASSYVRAEDAALLTGLVEDPSLRHLSLFRIAPTVLVSLVPAATLQAALRDRGLASTVEGPDGRVVRTERLRTTARSRVGGRRPLDTATRGRSAVGPVVHQEDATARRERYAELVPRLRAADDAALAAPPATTTPVDVAPEPRGTTEPPAALGLLRDAIDAGDHVVLETIDPTGQPTRRRVKPLVLEGGRLRALDPARDAELTVAVHRIAGVFTDAPTPTQDASTDATTNASAGAPND
ncbi:helicase-associated domain-containing protein [Oerskovia sp. NPDC057915]|uniref:helicase-associated domain-containing protein n=1 Tax=Oerskovia sp. NPDC057915 TaxID=3346280 RepID=UPI0036D9E4D9